MRGDEAPNAGSKRVRVRLNVVKRGRQPSLSLNVGMKSCLFLLVFPSEDRAMDVAFSISLFNRRIGGETEKSAVEQTD